MERVALMQSLLPSAKGFDNTVHLSPDLGFIYFSNPIVACSTMKATLNRATARALGLPEPGLRLDQIHDRAANPLKRPSDIGLPAFAAMLDDPAVRKITVIRDPLRRFMSCFGKKLLRENRITERLRSYLAIPPGTELSEALTPDRFIAALEADARLLNMNDHWRPQRRQVFFDLVPDMHVGRVETLADDIPWLLTPIFGSDGHGLIDVPAMLPQNTSRSREVPPLSPGGVEAVGRVYAGDAQMLAEVTARRPLRAAIANANASHQPAGVVASDAAGSRPAPRLWQAPLPDPARPQLIVHVGMAGIGGEAIAAALAAAGPRLAADAAIDLGPTPLLQSKIALDAALPLPADTLADLGAAWAARLATRASEAGAVRLVISNTALGAHPRAMAALLSQMHQQFAVRVVIFARDPHAWLPVAAMAGRSDPQAMDALLGQYRHVLDWLQLLPGRVEVHPCRGDTDMVSAANAVFGLTLPHPAANIPGNDDPATTAVRAMLSAHAGHGAVPPFDMPFASLAASDGSAPTTAAVRAAIAEHTGIFNAITKAGGPDLLALSEPLPPVPAPHAVRTRLLEVLAGLAVDQATRIAALEARIAALEGPSSLPGREA